MTASTFPPPPKVRESRFDDWMWRFYKDVATIGTANSPSPFSLPFFNVKKYGARGDGVTDDTAAFQACAAAVVSAGGGTIYFEPGKTYRVWGSTTGNLFSLIGANGVIVMGNGATIDSAQVNPTLGACRVFEIGGVNGFAVDSLTFIGGNTTLTFSTGEQFLRGYNGTHNVRVSNCVVKDCAFGALCDSSSSSASRGWYIQAYFEKCYYPLSGYYLEDVKANLVTRNCGRSYFPGNPANNHEVDIDSQQGNDFSDVLIKVYANNSYTTAQNTVSNIRVNYRSSGRYSGAGNADNEEACVAFDIQQATSTTAAGHVRNIRINFDVDCTSDKFANLLIFRKYKDTGAGDNTTTRGHTIRDVTISGTATNWNNATQNGVRLFSTTSFTTAQDWTGDTIENICLRDLRIQGAPATDSIYVNGQGASSSTQFLLMDNVHVDGPITTANVSSANVAYRATKASNVAYVENRRIAYTPTWASTGTQPALGNGTLTAEYARDGEYIQYSVTLAPGSTTTFGTGIYTFTIPVTAAGSQIAVGSAYALESGVQYFTGACSLSGTGAVTLWLGGTTGNNWGATTPWTLKNGDSVTASIRYRI